jgi:hypothetical protein
MTTAATRSLSGIAARSTIRHRQAADCVIVPIDAGRPGEALVNQRLAHMALSRGRYDPQIFTNDKAQLVNPVSRDVSHRSAIERPVERGQPLMIALVIAHSGPDPSRMNRAWKHASGDRDCAARHAPEIMTDISPACESWQLLIDRAKPIGRVPNAMVAPRGGERTRRPTRQASRHRLSPIESECRQRCGRSSLPRVPTKSS